MLQKVTDQSGPTPAERIKYPLMSAQLVEDGRRKALPVAEPTMDRGYATLIEIDRVPQSGGLAHWHLRLHRPEGLNEALTIQGINTN